MRPLILLATLIVLVAPLTTPAAETNALPDDVNWPFVTLVLHDDWQQRPSEVALVHQWEAARQQPIHLQHYTEGSTIFRENLSQFIAVEPPMAILQQADGHICDPALDVSIGVEAPALFGRLFGRGRGQCDGGQCDVPPKPTPEPPPKPPTYVIKPPAVQPVVEPEPEGPSALAIFVMCGAFAIVGVFVVIVRHFKQ